MSNPNSKKRNGDGASSSSSANSSGVMEVQVFRNREGAGDVVFLETKAAFADVLLSILNTPVGSLASLAAPGAFGRLQQSVDRVSADFIDKSLVPRALDTATFLDADLPVDVTMISNGMNVVGAADGPQVSF